MRSIRQPHRALLHRQESQAALLALRRGPHRDATPSPHRSFRNTPSPPPRTPSPGRDEPQPGTGWGVSVLPASHPPLLDSCPAEPRRTDVHALKCRPAAGWPWARCLPSLTLLPPRNVESNPLQSQAYGKAPLWSEHRKVDRSPSRHLSLKHALPSLLFLSVFDLLRKG